MLPLVSIVVPTYVRTQLLAEVVESFRRQTYRLEKSGPLELVILNDCPRQTLRCDVAGVRIINAPRFPSFAAKINALFAAVHGSLIIRCDDDDLLLPDAVKVLVDKLSSIESQTGKVQPVARLKKQLRWDGAAMTSRVCGVHHAAIIRRDAWNAAGGFRDVPGVDADLEFWNRVTLQWFIGRPHHEDDGQLQTIYRADPGRTHMEPSPGVIRSAAFFQELQDEEIRSGREPAGVVTISPSWSRDWSAEADAFQKVSHD